MFNKHCLFSIARLVGNPLTIDAQTAYLSRPSLAKVCVQVDLLKKLPSRVWLERGDAILGYWQPFRYNLMMFRSTVKICGLRA